MAEDYKIQLSLKRGDDMVNIRASNAAEFHSLALELSALEELTKFFPKSNVVRLPASPGSIIEVPEGQSVEEALTQNTTPDAPKQSALELARARMKGGQL